jgi:hypothetical protein
MMGKNVCACMKTPANIHYRNHRIGCGQNRDADRRSPNTAGLLA